MWRTLTTALALTLLAACGSDPEPAASADTTTTAGITLPAGIPPKPDQATADAYIAGLVAINPSIVYRGTTTDGDTDTAINRGRDQCSTIHGGADRARQVETTQARFTSPDAPNGWDQATAERILDVVHQHLCPNF